MKYDKLPPEHRIIRHAGWNRLRKDEDGVVYGLAPQAFTLADGHEGLSVTWVDYFEGDPVDRMREAVNAFRASMDKPIGSKSAFGVAVVGHLVEVCASASPPANVRVVHMPEDRNPAHAEITRYPREAEALRMRLAAEVFADFFLNSDFS